MMKLMRMLKMAKMKRPWSKSWNPQQQLDMKHILGPILRSKTNYRQIITRVL